MSDQRFALTLSLQHGYQFTVDFAQEGVTDLLVDEPAPLGSGAGPNPARLLGAAIGSCLGASLVFCLRRAHIQPQALRVAVNGTLVRNERGRLRIGRFTVKLEPAVSAEDQDRVRSCLDVFEDYCIVTQSVRQGVDVAVEVEPVVQALEAPQGVSG